MQTCSQCNTQNNDTATSCTYCNADLSEFSTTAAALKRFQENSRVMHVYISVAHDCCPACRAVEGAYEKDNVPKVPVDGCSNPLGCRCFYSPMLNVIYP